MWIVRPPIARIVLEEAGLVQRVGVDLHLHVQLVARVERGVDDRGHRAPVLVDLQADGAGPDLLERRLDRVRRPLPRKPKLSGKPSAACSIRPRFSVPEEQIPTVTGPRPLPSSVVRGGDRLLAEAGGVEVDVDVDAAGGDDHALKAHVGVGADDQAGGVTPSIGCGRRPCRCRRCALP